MENKIISIKFRGVDHFNRPIFKDINSSSHYGSTVILFSHNDSPEKIIKYFKSNIHELRYFGSSFGCEPYGTPINKDISLKIIN